LRELRTHLKITKHFHSKGPVLFQTQPQIFATPAGVGGAINQ